jgi:hypothetical protein
MLALWLAAVVTGQWVLLAHATTPGACGMVPERLPAAIASAVHAPADQPLLLLAAHPQCPCLPATLEEIERARAAGTPFALRVLWWQPDPLPAAWSTADAAAVAATLPAGSCIVDANGALAAALGLPTSGHLALYDTAGRLRFQGGITAGRGHRGDNPASRTLRACLRGETDAGKSPAFGCPLGADTYDHERDCCRSQ